VFFTHSPTIKDINNILLITLALWGMLRRLDSSCRETEKGAVPLHCRATGQSATPRAAGSALFCVGCKPLLVDLKIW